jgi:hypothetical protein
MARQKLKLSAEFIYYVEPQDYVDEFSEEQQLEEDDDVDQDALLDFAVAKVTEALEEGDLSFDDADLSDVIVTVV